MTLTEAAHWTKKLIWFVVLGIFLFFLILSLLLRQDTVKDPLYSEANYACTTYAGDFLEHRLEIPSLPYIANPGIFRIETDTGRFDQFPDIVNVYRYANPGQTLTSQRDAKLIAESLGFNPETMRRTGTTTYRWEDRYNRELTVQARNLPFLFAVDLSRRNNLPPADSNLPSSSEAVNRARTFLRGANLLNTDYASESPTTIDIAIEPDGSFREAKARVEADLVRVDFQRMKSMITIPENVEGAKAIKESLERRIGDSTRYNSRTSQIQTPQGRIDIFTFEIELVNYDPNKSNISIYMGPINTNLEIFKAKDVYRVEYKNWIIESDHCGTYQLISPDVAIEQIQAGKGSLVYLREKDSDIIVPHREKTVERFDIRNISIRYYDSPEEQTFLQPIYTVYGDAIFSTGEDGEFVFYYPAIDYGLVRDSL
jgi:hypothetical protein